MLKKHRDLLHYLQNNEASYVTSTQIAQHLQISKRSVKTYCKEINDHYKKNILISTTKGYHINPDYKTMIDQQTYAVPQNYNERVTFILKKLLLEQEYISIDDFCECLYIGESTLKAILVKMNKAYANYHVKFTTKDDMVMILADEKAKRHLISNCIFEETGSNMLNLSLLQEYFPFFEPEEIRSHIISIFDQFNYYIDDFSLMNLMLHLLININRIIDGNLLECETSVEQTDDQACTCIDQLCNYLENEFHIALNQREIKEIEILISATSVLKDESYADIIDVQFLNLSKEIATKVVGHYAIELCDDSFILPFALHLKKLSIRIQKNVTARNPLCDDIKRNCPFLYDVAIYIAMQIQHALSLETMLCEEEIAYIALHIGAELERQKDALPKLKCALLCPSYMEYQKSLYHQLQREFHDEIQLTPPVSDENQLQGQHYDIIFATIPLHRQYKDSIILSVPLIGTIDYRYIITKIEEIKMKHRYLILTAYFHHFFHEDFFYIATNRSKRSEVLSFQLKELKAKGYVEDDFIQALNERENACPTCFRDFAIPHSIKMNAERSCISVYICSKGIDWGGKQIHIVFLIAINKADRIIFKDVYESLIHLLNHETYLHDMINCENFCNFKDIVFQKSQCL